MGENNSATLVLVSDVSTGDPYTTSEIIAEGTEISHRRIREAIRKYKNELEAFGKVVAYQTTLQSGQSVPGYILNEQQATFLLTLLKNTPVVIAFKKELVRQFYIMRSRMMERASPIWKDTRSLCKEIRRQESDTIKRFVEYATERGSRNAGHYYTNLSRLADRTVGIVDRDKAQTVQLTSLLLVEKIIDQEITAGIETEIPYRDIYQGIKEKLESFGGMVALAGKET